MQSNSSSFILPQYSFAKIVWLFVYATVLVLPLLKTVSHKQRTFWAEIRGSGSVQMQPEQLGPLSVQIPLTSLLNANLFCLTRANSRVIFHSLMRKVWRPTKTMPFTFLPPGRLKNKTKNFIKQFELLSIVYLPFS